VPAEAPGTLGTLQTSGQDLVALQPAGLAGDWVPMLLSRMILWADMSRASARTVQSLTQEVDHMTRSARVVVPCLLATALALAGCAGSETPPPVSPPRAGNQASASRVAAAAAAGRLPRGYARVEWIGEVHALAMEQVVANGRRLRSSGSEARCRFIESVARGQIPRIMRESGVSNPQVYETGIAQAKARVGCSSAVGLSVFGRALAYRGPEDDTTVTGAFDYYSSQAYDAVEYASSPEGASASLDAVLNQATADGLGSGDLTVLSAAVSFGKSSADYWYSIEQSGYGPGDSIPNQYSIFGSYSNPLFSRFWNNVGKADLVGMFMGALMGSTGGCGGAIVIGLLGGVIGSSVAYILQS